MELKGNYRGIKPAHIVEVLEGDGTEAHPYETVQYVVAMVERRGVQRMVTIGRIERVSDIKFSWSEQEANQ